MGVDLVPLLFAGAAIVAGAVLQRVSGLGVGLVVGPVLAIVFGPALGILVTNIVATMSGFLLMIAVWRNIEWRTFWIIIATGLLGIIPGALLVRELSAAWLQIVVGSLVVLSVLSTMMTTRLPRVQSRSALGIAGIASGFCNVTAGVAGPVLAVYARLSGWEHIRFAATVQPIFMTMGALSAGTKFALGSTGADGFAPWWFFAGAAVLVIVGAWVGGRIARHVSSMRARTLAILIAGLGGAVVLVRGLVGVA